MKVQNAQLYATGGYVTKAGVRNTAFTKNIPKLGWNCHDTKKNNVSENNFLVLRLCGWNLWKLE